MPPYEDKGIYSGEFGQIAFGIYAKLQIILLNVH
jgi:hypothetical protein